MLTLQQAALLFAIAVVSGSMNAVAGGGSFLSFPALLLVGVPPIQANATNTIALWPGLLGSVGAYRDELRGPEARHVLFPLLCTGVVGGALAPSLFWSLRQQTFLHLIPYLLLSATLVFAFSRKITTTLQVRTAKLRSLPKPARRRSFSSPSTSDTSAPEPES